MPGKRLEPNSVVAFPRFAIIGAYAPGNGSFVRHVGILRDRCDVQFGDEVGVWHAAPPIVAGERTSDMSPDAFDLCTVHVGAYLEDFSADDAQGIETSLADIDAQTPLLPASCAESVPRANLQGYRSHYTAHPPVEWVRDAKTGRRRYRKFSCSGFVVECYKGAGIVLVEFENDRLPEVDLPTLRQGYGELIDNPERRSMIGLDGDGPWRMLLAGYVVHAVARKSSVVREKPYCPSNTDAATFP